MIKEHLFYKFYNYIGHQKKKNINMNILTDKKREHSCIPDFNLLNTMLDKNN